MADGHEAPAEATPSTMLAGVRVVDLTHHIAGPYCTKWLATLGADVLKVERPAGGDLSRRMGPFPEDLPHPEKSGLFLYLNTGKRSVSLNLKTKTGRALLLRLVERADVVVENFAPRVLPSLGLDYGHLAAVNPRLVMTSISNFGQTGPYRDLRATEIVLFGMGGLMYLIGFPDEAPLKFGGYQSLYMGGLSGFTATMMALTHAEMTGKGQQADVSLFEGMACSHFQSMVQYEYTGAIPCRSPGFGVYPCRDGYVGMVIFDQHWQRFIEVLGLPELREPRFATLETRLRHHEEFETLLLSWVLERSKQEIYALGQGAGLPFAFFATVDDLLSSPQYEARGFFAPVEHPAAGTYRYPGSPLRIDGEPPELQRAPLLGEHNEEILCSELGLERRDMVALRAQGVI